jgi:hypothetical protein
MAELYAQDPDNSTTTTITYSRTTRKAEDHGKYNSIKIDPLGVLAGEIPVHYERRLTNKLSAEIMVGITHSDYAFLVFNTDFTNNTGTRMPKFGYLFGGALKFYPSSETYALEGPFFGVDFRYKVYFTEIDNTCSPTSSADVFDETRSVIDGKLFGGYNWIFADAVTVEVFAGVGIRSQTIDGYICTGSSSPVATFAKFDDNTQRLALSIGAKIGFLF